jgi:hypothetical protein
MHLLWLILLFIIPKLKRPDFPGKACVQRISCCLTAALLGSSTANPSK